jgi:hypothetical protein
MTDTEKKATQAETENPTVVTTQPATVVTHPSRGAGRGILIGVAAAALVGGLGIGAVGGFALANATHPRPQLVSQTGPMGGQQGGPSWHQSGPGQGQGQNGMPGQPPQGGQAPQGGGSQQQDGDNSTDGN